MRDQREDDNSPQGYISRPRPVENWWQDFLNSCYLAIRVLIVEYGYVVLDINTRNRFVSRLVGMFVLDDHTQEWVLLDALF